MQRSAPELDGQTIKLLHKKLEAFDIVIPANPSPKQSRKLFSTIRQYRSIVARIAATMLRHLSLVKSELVRVERLIEAKTVRIGYTGDGIGLAKNETQRRVYTKYLLEDIYDLKADLEADKILLDGVWEHAKMVQTELRLVFDELSRGISAIELELKINSTAP